MKEIQEGDFFEATTHKQKQAIELVIKNLRKGQTDKGILVNKLNQEIYNQRKDCKTLIQNLAKSSNHYVNFKGKRNLVLGRENEVTV